MSIRSAPGYVPRLADDRVGFWEDPHLNFDRDDRYHDLARYIMRWNAGEDPSKPSPAKKPLVYTLTNTIPPKYRAPFAKRCPGGINRSPASAF